MIEIWSFKNSIKAGGNCRNAELKSESKSEIKSEPKSEQGASNFEVNFLKDMSGIGQIDFCSKIAELDESDYLSSLDGDYAKFKLGNVSKYFEIEVLKDHAVLLANEIKDGKLKEILLGLNDGYIVIKKAF